MCMCEGDKQAEVHDPTTAIANLFSDLAQLRGMLLGTMAQIELLEKEVNELTQHVVRIESGGY